MKRAGRIALWLFALTLAGGAAFLTYIIASFSAPVATEYANRLPFNAATWRKHREPSDPLWPIRLRMADHLLAKQSFKGMHTGEVIQLLGPPDDTTYFAAPGTLVYYLGPERGMFRIDSEWLVIETQDSRVTSAEIRKD